MNKDADRLRAALSRSGLFQPDVSTEEVSDLGDPASDAGSWLDPSGDLDQAVLPAECEAAAPQVEAGAILEALDRVFTTNPVAAQKLQISDTTPSASPATLDGVLEMQLIAIMERACAVDDALFQVVHLDRAGESFRARQKTDRGLLELGVCDAARWTAFMGGAAVREVTLMVRGLQRTHRCLQLTTRQGSRFVIKRNDVKGPRKFDDLGLDTEQASAIRRILHHDRGAIVFITTPRNEPAFPILNVCALECARRNGLVASFADLSLSDGHPNIITLPASSTLSTAATHGADVIITQPAMSPDLVKSAIRAALGGWRVLMPGVLRDITACRSMLRLYQIDASVLRDANAVIFHQRSVRSLCGFCRADDREAAQRLSSLPVLAEAYKNATFLTSRGCERCTDGFDGRVALIQQFSYSDFDSAGADCDEPAVVLQEALRLAARGRTSLQEVVRLYQRCSGSGPDCE